MRRRILIACGLALVLAAGASLWYVNRQTPEKAIAQVAKRLDVPFPRTNYGQAASLVLSDGLSTNELYNFFYAYQTVFGRDWQGTLRQQGLHVGWPGDLQFLTRAQGGQHDGTTACMGRPTTVSADTTTVFYCVLDRMQVPDAIPYQQGTLWVPIDALFKMWRYSAPVTASTVPEGNRIGQAMFVYLVAAWGNGLTRQIRAYAASEWGLHLPVLEQVDAALVFSYCIAGAMAAGVFDPPNDVTRALQILFGDQLSPGQAKEAAALQQGYSRGTLGGCVRNYWPVKGLPVR